MTTETQRKGTLSEPAEPAKSSGAPVLDSFDVHACGQLRIGAAGDQLELLALEDDRIAASSGAPLASPHLVPTTEGDPNE